MDGLLQPVSVTPVFWLVSRRRGQRPWQHSSQLPSIGHPRKLPLRLP